MAIERGWIRILRSNWWSNKNLAMTKIRNTASKGSVGIDNPICKSKLARLTAIGVRKLMKISSLSGKKMKAQPTIITNDNKPNQKNSLTTNNILRAIKNSEAPNIKWFLERSFLVRLLIISLILIFFSGDSLQIIHNNHQENHEKESAKSGNNHN